VVVDDREPKLYKKGRERDHLRREIEDAIPLSHPNSDAIWNSYLLGEDWTGRDKRRMEED
jgi:hypothetical protein